MTESGSWTWLLLAAVPAVAFVYSAVGHGGATGYLALMGLAAVAPDVARGSALATNVFVAGLAWWRFQKAGCFNGRLLLALAAGSIPCAWAGSRVHLSQPGYDLVLGGALLCAAVLLWLQPESDGEAAQPGSISPAAAAIAGGGLGFVAGLTGIGGGVFLSPLLLLLNWTPAKVGGGIAAAFIVLNSLAGLAGMSGRGAFVFTPFTIGMAVLAVAGAWFGTHYGACRWRTLTFRRTLAGVLAFAGLKLTWSAFF